MIDYGAQKTDLAVLRTEWRLSRVYHQAAQDIEDKLKAFEKRHEAAEKRYRQQVADGKITQADFDAWMRGQVFQGKQWQARKEQIQQTLLQADQTAAKIVNEGKLGVFADNANYMGYGLEHDANINTGFMLYDEQTVARLIKDDPKMLPPAKVKKDKAFAYYNKLVNNSVTLGIVEGEDIRQIAKRIAKTTGESSYKSAMRNARTAYTGAQNAGRIEGLHQAQRLGIKVQKKWLATLDSRTRDAHADLDGQIRDVDEPFDSELGPIDYPGDASADSANVYNCRCTLVYVYPEYPSDMQRRDNETGEIVGDMTYREWEERKKGFTSSQKESIIDSNEGDSVTGSLQQRRKHEKIETLEDATALPTETAEVVKTFNRIEGEHTRKDDIEKTNPHYLEGLEWQQNCQRCCPAFEARRRGFDVTAEPLNGTPYNDDYARGVMGYTKFFDRGSRVPENIYRKLGLDRNTVTLEQIKNGIGTIMDSYGNGSRAIINGYWQSGGDGHVFIAENVEGVVHFYDVQSGNMNYTRPFEAMETRSMSIFRIDDLPFAEDIGKAVRNND